MKILITEENGNLGVEMRGPSETIIHGLAVAVAQVYTGAVDREKEPVELFTKKFSDEVALVVKLQDIKKSVRNDLKDLLKELLGDRHG